MTAKQDATGWDDILESFPRSVRPQICDIRDSGGILDVARVDALRNRLDMGIEDLMVRLLPVAARFAVPDISHYHVGAVARGMEGGDGGGALYFGANLEFRGQALGFAVHAEQAAVNNAWLNGASGLRSLAVSAAPCGLCRQFLYELVSGPDLILLMQQGQAGNVDRSTLGAKLPHAFGPSDLGNQCRLMASHPVQLALVDDTKDRLTRAALAAAAKSYVPYTSGYAGCAIQVEGAGIYTGRYAENVAYNPSLPPLASAIAYMRLNRALGDDRAITRAVLVEVPSRSSQRDASRAVLSAHAPPVTLEYATARLASSSSA